MEKHTLEAISITALVISVFVLIVLVFKMVIKHLYANGSIKKMNGGDANKVSELLTEIKDGIKNIAVAYSPGSDGYDNAITDFTKGRNMMLILYAIFSLVVIEGCTSEERTVADSLLNVCTANLNMNDSLTSRTIDMLETQRSSPIPIRTTYALDDEWLQYLGLPSNASARRVQLN